MALLGGTVPPQKILFGGTVAFNEGNEYRLTKYGEKLTLLIAQRAI